MQSIFSNKTLNYIGLTNNKKIQQSFTQIRFKKKKSEVKTTQVKKKDNFETCTIQECMLDPCKPEPKVVIIGAGVAGLSCAQRLAQCGLTKFKILEANDRPGGRVHSCWLGDVVTEMGAHYIDGACISNPVYNLAAQEGLLKTPAKRINIGETTFCTSDGRAVDSHITSHSLSRFKIIKREAANLFQLGIGREHGSLQDFFALRIQQELQNIPDEQRYDAVRVMYGLTHLLRGQIGEDLHNVSADNFGSLIPIPGGKIFVPLGFIGIISPLLRDLPCDCVRFKKPVATIKWGDSAAKEKGSRVQVICCDGEQFGADYAVITVSLGVLKEHATKMFCPQLPEPKMEAIRKLGYGVINKIFLDYERPFWIWNEGNIGFAWSPDELTHRDDWTKGLCKIEEVPGSKHILVAHIAGTEAAIMEHATDEEIAEGLTCILRQFTGDASLPYPSKVLRSRWATDPFFCGSNSFISVDANVGHQCDLSAPVPSSCAPTPPILMFAGEATCAGHYSKVQGARMSGIREAERILQLTKKFSGPPPMKT